jgi:hypothetical protein
MLQSINILQYKSHDANPGAKFSVAVFPTRTQAQEFIDGSPGIIYDEPFEFGLEGVYIETYLDLAKRRIQELNVGDFACRENSLAITKIEEALHWLKARADERAARGVLGKREA